MRTLEGYRSNLVILAVSAAMALSGAFLITFGPEAAVNPDNPFIRTSLWPIAVVLFGSGGVVMYLAKGMTGSRRLRNALGLLSLIPIVLVLAMSAAAGSEASLAWLLPSVVFAALGLFRDEPASGDEKGGLFPFYAASVLMLFGAMMFVHFPWRSLGFPFAEILRIPAIAIGAACALVHARPEWRRFRPHALAAAGLALAGVAVIAALFVNRHILAIFYGPAAIVALGYPFLARFRLGAPVREALTEENGVILKFQDVAEVIAWSVFLFSYVHIYLTPHLQRPFIFFLFLTAFILFSYQYRMRPLREFATAREFARTSVANAILLAVVSHFTGGLSSPYNVFFVFVLLSGAVLADPKGLLRRLSVIGGYLGFELAYTVVVRRDVSAAVFDEALTSVFLVLLTGLYVYHLTKRRVEADHDLMNTNKELLKTIDREREMRELVSQQALELEQARSQLDAVLGSVSDAIIAVDRDGKVRMMNASAESLLMTSLKDARGKDISLVLPLRIESGGAFDAGSEIRAALATPSARPRSGGISGRRIIPLPQDAFTEAGGKRRFIEGEIVDTPLGGEEARAVITFRDITFRRELDRMKNDFISVAAHQLRTPLASIRWYLELLNDPKEGRLNKNQKMFARNAYSSTRRMLALVNGLLAVTRVEAGKVPIRPEPTDLGTIVRESLDGFAAAMAEKRIRHHLSVEAELPAIPLDRTLAREVVSNLLENAIRYSPEEGEILVRIEPGEDELLLSVADNGIGIPESQKDRIFEKFFRASNAVSRSSEGTGLGLYLVKFIVGLWNGRIWFESEEGKGTTFRVTVPLGGMSEKKGTVSLHA